MDVTRTRTGPRVAALDGLRGVTIIMVILGHHSLIWPNMALAAVPAVDGLFLGGAVVIFFIVGGYVVTRGLLAERERGALDPLKFYLRRILRLGVQLVPLVLAILMIHKFDPTDPSRSSDTLASIANVLTYTWNYYAIDNVFSARGDLGHLWYLSVQQQVYLVLPLAVLLLGGLRRGFAALLLVGTVAITINRFRVLGDDGWFTASLLTTTRADGLLLGALIAVTLPFLTRWAKWSSTALGLSATAMVALVLLHASFGPLSFLKIWGVMFAVAATVAVTALVVGGPLGMVGRILGTRWLTAVGNASLPLFVWHVPIFVTIARHTPEWSPSLRSIVGLAVLVAVTILAQRFIEEPTRRWLRDSSRFRSRPRDLTPSAGCSSSET
ncbi:acyltransferase family protein [Knoellia aerolata]|uniref:Acyltransferase 3 domain-containing protein n=1 Tax=Knoellia aerolata DSM 18566 TaxID=1385519 RepID=A0A0A0K4X1_9MICO|nr:acyltransferase [Knoellia aerolata]KGN42881.1 hypothetical protein N801_11220 [Knoellia aerolata DSM 18566]